MPSIDIIQEVQRQIGSDPIPKIDPNTQAQEPEKVTMPDVKNGVIPALLVGFYEHTRNEDQATELMNEKDPENTLNLLFGDQKNSIIKSISSYAGVSESTAEREMKNTVSAIKNILETEIKNGDGKTVSAFFSDQRSNILKHLPAELNMGELMEDSSIDDRTNKMEGPMSGLAHVVEKIFSSTK